jgi:tetratricopeptide (TPR) repeat protein
MAARLEEILDADGRLIRHIHREPDDAELDEMRRREMLRVLAMAGAAVATGALGVDVERLEGATGQRLDIETVNDLAALNAHLWRVFTLARSKSAVSPLVRDQLGVLTDWLQNPQRGEVHRRLCELAGDLFQLAGEVAFDGNQYTDAAHCYTLAATAAREANAPDLWACALTRHAFISVYERQFTAAAPMLDLAAGLARHGDGTLSTRHWVAAVQAETYAGLGNLDACQAALDAAGRVSEMDGPVHNGGWLRFDGSRLAEQRGTCYAALGRPDLAEAALSAALAEHLSLRRRASVHTGLAMVGVQRRDIDLIAQHAEATVKIARETGSGVVARQLHGLHRNSQRSSATGR